MLYNYDQCVQSIQEHRRRAYSSSSTNGTSATTTPKPDLEALQQSMDGFATLSKNCPMTPLLWMQYAHDTEILMEGLMMLESGNGGGGNEQQRLQMQAKKGALESSTGILELALAEYSGCSLLHLYYLESLADCIYQITALQQLNKNNGMVGVDMMDDNLTTLTKLSTAFERAWKCVGSGSHVNEGMIVSDIYRLQGSFLLFLLSTSDVSSYHSILQQLSKLFIKWSQTPMGEGSNHEMMQDMEYMWGEACSLVLKSCNGDNGKKKQTQQQLDQQKAILWSNIDDERKKTSSLMNTLSSYENEVDVAMSNEGISLPRMSLFSQQDEIINNGSDTDDLHVRHLQSLKRSSMKWNQILVSDTNRFLSGLGGSETSRAFTKATSILQRVYQDVLKKSTKSGGKKDDETSPLEDYVAEYKDSAIRSLYERAISECPTVETLWVSYLNFLRSEWTRLQSKIKGQKHVLQGEELYMQKQQKEDLSSTLQSASHRAIRNCPYSGTLFEIRMTTLGMVSLSNLEPDDITAVVQEATELGFLSHNRGAMLHLRLLAILVVKRRLLSLVSLGTTTSANGEGKDYDGGEDIASLSVASAKKPTNGAVSYQSLNPTAMEEVQDLLEDIRDMYDEADAFLFKSHPTWVEGKVVFWKHRAQTEAYVLCPIGLVLKEVDDEMASNESAGVADEEAIKCYEKLVKAQKPSHPDSWREYIKYISTSQLYLPGDANNSTQTQPGSTAVTASTIRKTRGLYLRAMGSMKKAGQEVTSAVPMTNNTQAWMGKGMEGAMYQRDYDSALSDLCREYLDFERTSGSEESFSNAQTLVRGKLANWAPPVLSTIATTTASLSNNHEESSGKRKLDANNDSIMMNTESHDHHQQEEEEEEYHDTQTKKRVKVVTNLKQPKKTDGVHKVKIGKLEYPAHPYTVHVSNLSKETQDMDLVDALRSEFGDIVHAKILREKRTGKGGHHYHGESKCAALVQFEERLSVENALQRSGDFEVGGKIIKIQRSYLPAVGVVPAGCHRVNPKGDGKASGKNQFKKKSKMKIDTNESMDIEGAGNQQTQKPAKKKNHIALESPSAISLGVLSFKPRGMRQKPKISLSDVPKKK